MNNDALTKMRSSRAQKHFMLIFFSSPDDSLVHLAGIFHNLYMKIEETESVHYGGDTGWKVYIHDARDRPTLGVSTHGTSLYHGQGRDLRLDIKKVRSIKS